MLKFLTRKSHRVRPSQEIKAQTVDDSKVELFSYIQSYDLAKELLSAEILDAGTLDTVLHKFCKGDARTSDTPRQLTGLRTAIERFETFVRKLPDKEEWNFYRHLLPKLVLWALEDTNLLLPNLPALPNTASVSATLKVTRRQVRYLLAHCFFLNAKSQKGMSYGDLSFKHLYNSKIPLGFERMICMLAYFYQAQDFDDLMLAEEVEFKRIATSTKDFFSWDECNTKLAANCVNIHVDTMETPEDPFFVNFANKQLQVGEIVASATQEEILCTCAPEALIGLLFCETLQDHEVLLISNLKRYSKYTGFMDSFKFSGFYPSSNYKFSMLVLDASYEDHFSEKSIYRDLNKAHVGFAEARSRGSAGVRISTGNWGCGAFGGDTNAKFAQQLCAALAAGVTLSYSTFGDATQAQLLTKLITIFESKEVTVADICKLMKEYHQEIEKRRIDTFVEFLALKLDFKLR